jgi:hypothetical protein
MYQLVLLTALTTTTGLFGGARTCSSGHCGSAAPAYYAPAPAYSSCANGSCGATAPAASYAPAPTPYYSAAAPAQPSYHSYYYPPAAPAQPSYSSYYYPPAAPAQPSYSSYSYPAAAPAQASYSAYYSAPATMTYAPFASSCANGNCPRR